MHVSRLAAELTTCCGAAALALGCAAPRGATPRALPPFWVVVRNSGTMETRVWVSLDGVSHDRSLGRVSAGQSACFRLDEVDQWLLAEMPEEGPSLDPQTPPPTPDWPTTPGNFVTTIFGTHDRRSDEFYPGMDEATWQLNVWDQAARLLADIPDSACLKHGGAR